MIVVKDLLKALNASKCWVVSFIYIQQKYYNILPQNTYLILIKNNRNIFKK